MVELKALQNGSDIRGIALDTEEQTATLTATAVAEIAVGVVRWLQDKKQLPRKAQQRLTIAIGHDSRLTAEPIKQALVDTFLSLGIQVIDVGLATTPAMFMATQFPTFQCDAAIMITASHLPYYFNGLKFFTAEGGAEKEDIRYILSHTDPLTANENGTLMKQELLPIYAEHLVAKIRQGIHSPEEKPLQGFRIIVDAGNGAGGFFAEQVLQVLGADTTGSQFLEPNGHFPNHVPNPDNSEAMKSIQTAVLANQADLGIIFDTDVDRSAVVDQSGEVLNRNNLIAVLAAIVLKEAPGSYIVTNSPTSSHLKTFIEEKGGQQIRYISGYRNVINKMIELNHGGFQTPLAIETSGHAAFQENYNLDDGAYVVAKILMLLPELKQNNQTLGDLIATLKQPAETNEFRFKITAEDVTCYGQQVLRDFELFVENQADFAVDRENQEGVRGNVSGQYGSGWFLLRLSLHEPLLVLQVENDQSDKNACVIEKIATFLQKYEEIDSQQIENNLGN